MKKSILNDLPREIFTCVVTYFDNISILMLTMTSKNMKCKIENKKININEQYMQLKKCAICKQKHNADYFDRESGLFAHINCINRICKKRALYNSRLSSWIIHHNSTSKLNSIILNGFKYNEIIHSNNNSTVSTILINLNKPNWMIYDFKKNEDNLLKQHVWFLNVGHSLLDYYKKTNNQTKSIKLTKNGPKINLYKLYLSRLFDANNDELPKNLGEINEGVYKLKEKIISFSEKLKIWFKNEKYSNEFNCWFNLVTHTLCHSSENETSKYVLKYVDNYHLLTTEIDSKYNFLN